MSISYTLLDTDTVSYIQTLDDCQVTGLSGIVCIHLYHNLHFIEYLVSGSLLLYRNGVVSSEFNSGIVVVQFGTIWGNVCQLTSVDSKPADVVCHQLSYEGASSWTTSSNEK